MVTCHHHRGGARVDDIRKLTGDIEMKKLLIAIAFFAAPFSAQADIWKSIILTEKVSAGPDVDYVEMYQYHPSENLCERAIIDPLDAGDLSIKEFRCELAK